jgi:hypothetical protein
MAPEDGHPIFKPTAPTRAERIEEAAREVLRSGAYSSCSHGYTVGLRLRDSFRDLEVALATKEDADD